MCLKVHLLFKIYSSRRQFSISASPALSVGSGPRCLQARLHPGRPASLSHDTQTTIFTHLRDNQAFRIWLTRVLSAKGKHPGRPERTHADTRTARQFHAGRHQTWTHFCQTLAGVCKKSRQEVRCQGDVAVCTLSAQRGHFSLHIP